MTSTFFLMNDQNDGAGLKPQTINVTKAANNLHRGLKHAANLCAVNGLLDGTIGNTLGAAFHF